MQNTNNYGPLTVRSTRIFTEEDQLVFAAFSGDYNPIHMDSVESRRTLGGQRIVHGINCLMWVLDEFYDQKKLRVSKLKVRFIKPIFLYEPISFAWDQKQRILVTTNGITLAIINIEFGDFLGVHKKLTPRIPRLKLLNAINRTFVECLNLGRTEIDICGSPSLGAKQFPNLCYEYGAHTVCELAAISEIVGMQCPGLQSLLASVELVFGESDEVFNYKVETSDERFGLLNLRVTGQTLQGVVGTIFRPEPVKNPSMEEVATEVTSAEFSQINALIIGGSKGIGEIVAKIIAAGGGQTTITFNTGKSDAESVQSEIKNWGGICELQHFSINDPNTPVPIKGYFNQIYSQNLRDFMWMVFIRPSHLQRFTKKT
jgi:hypothetical protein